MAPVRTRKTPSDAAMVTPTVAPSPRPRKKPRAARVRLTHLEVRRGATLCLRIAVADDTLAEVSDELGALIKKIAPSTPPSDGSVIRSVVDAVESEDFLISRQHTGDDAVYHAGVREHLAGLCNVLCDESLADALEIVRAERDRRSEGGN
jgi:hypothetical protein